MNNSIVALDKQFSTGVEDFGKIGIRVVVFNKEKKKSGGEGSNSADQPIDLASDEDFSAGDSEVKSYLEVPGKGKQCCVFIINGQRHHGVDNSFIVNDLRMKYLRKRMIVVIDLDGLTQRANAEVMQGSRSGLYEGNVYHRIRERLIATLKGDPELIDLEEEAEDELSQLQVGDAAVQQALDQLIENHFDAGDHEAEGKQESSGNQGFSVAADGEKVKLEVIKQAQIGDEASSPVLLCSHQGATYKLRPSTKGKLFVAVQPESEWKQLGEIVILAEPETAGFSYQLHRKGNHAVVEMEFVEPEGFDPEAYPLEIKLSVLAAFKDQPELRLVDKLVQVRPHRDRYKKPRVPPVLLDSPTFVKVVTRQPVRLTVDDVAVHVRFRWDGKDELVPDAGWEFSGICTSHKEFPAITFSTPVNGSFEGLIYTPAETLLGTKLKFEIKASRPGGVPVGTILDAEVVEPLKPRKISVDVPAHGQRRPPYKLVIVTEEQFSSSTRWGEETWDETHAGAFIDPKADAPLTLCINQDLSILKTYLDSLIAKKADEQRTQEKKTKYISHIAYHLYQMYLHKEKVLQQKESDATIAEPNDEAMQEEINRVGATLIKLMEVSR